MAERHPWERLEGETEKAWIGFEAFRKLGPGRSVDEAFRRYWMRPGNRRNSAGETKEKTPPYFSHWAVQYQWRSRAAAWDEEVAALARDQELDRELREKAREHEEEIRQRQLWKEEARAARTVARRLLMRALQGIDAQEIEGLSVREILPHMQRISTLLEVGQRLERMALGEATDRTAVEAEPGEQAKREIADMIFGEISEADARQLEALKQRLLAIKHGSQSR
jgi:hypothetical protein